MTISIFSGNRLVILLATVLVLFAGISHGQNPERQMELARKQLQSGNYAEAERIAGAVLKKDSLYMQAYFFLADLYHQSDSVTNEVIILKALNSRKAQNDQLFYYRLGKALFLSSDYDEAIEWFERYIAAQKTATARFEEVQRMLRNCRFAVEAMKNPVAFNPVRLGYEVNTEDDEYWPSISVDSRKLVFTRLLKKSSAGRLPQEDFYMAEADSGGWHHVKSIVEINTSGNEGAQSISADGRWLFFTACNRPEGKGSCDIFFSGFQDGKWSPPVPVPGQINTSGWEGQPSVSGDGKWLYFSTDRTGGKGRKDIWRSHTVGYNSGGVPVWSSPENLGDSVNTPLDEISPFIHANGSDLYFSSDFWPGMGGLDLFHVKLKSDLTWTCPQNLGYPLNTVRNEQGLVIDATGETGYFSSGRGRNSGMDIYTFATDKQFRPAPVTYVRATVTDNETGKPVTAQVCLENLSDKSQNLFDSDSEGCIFACLPVGSDYAFRVSKEGYLFYSQNFRLSEIRSSLNPYLLTIGLKPLKTGESMNLYNVFFRTGSAELLPESFPELEKLCTLLTDNPGLVVEIQGHTDNVGLKDYNQVLSEKRAKSVVDYLTSKNIKPERLTAKGFGMTLPLASNDSEEGRSKNRRTTVLILGNK